MDHLFHCILSLAQVVVHYGWWCRPHYWDESSERWAEMALLASGVFEHSMQSLCQVITFYLDHVCATTKHDETKECERLNQGEVESILSEENISGEPPLTQTIDCTDHRQGHHYQAEYIHSFPSEQSHGHSSTSGQSEESTTAEPSQPHSEFSKTFAVHLDSEDKPYAAAENPSLSYTTASCTQPENCSVSVQHTEGHTDGVEQPEAESRIGNPITHYSLSGDAAGMHLETGLTTVYRSPTPDSATLTSLAEPSRRESVDSAVHLAGCSQDTNSATKALTNLNSVELNSACLDPSHTAQAGLDMDTSAQTQAATNITPAADMVYYTVDGTLVTDTTATSCPVVGTTMASYCRDEGLCSQNTVYSVSHVGGIDQQQYCDTSRYLLLTEEAPPPSSPQIAEVTQIEASSKDSGTGTVSHISSSSDEVGCDPPSHELMPESATQHHHKDTELVLEAASIADGGENTSCSAADVDGCVDLFTVTLTNTLPVGDMVCSGEEVISDAAIMLSETVEVETDGMAEVNKMEDAETSQAPLMSDESSSDHKGQQFFF